MGAIFPITLPHFPRRSTARTQTFQLLLIFEGIHARPKAIVGIADQLLLRQQSVKGLDYQFFRTYSKIFFLKIKNPPLIRTLPLLMA